jgi:hypothetical protein
MLRLFRATFRRNFRQSYEINRFQSTAIENDVEVYNSSAYVNRRDLSFMASEVIDCESFLSKIDRYEGHELSTFENIFDSACELSNDVFLPINQVSIA